MKRVNQTILLTGATDGIGLELARRWKNDGKRLFVHGRRTLNEIGGIDSEIFCEDRYWRADLSIPSEVATATDFLNNRGVEKLDCLVLNAAAGWQGALESQSEKSIEELVETNLISCIQLCHSLFPLLLRARGRIVFISSVVSSLSTPTYAVYTATKAALEGFARSLRVELQGNIEVQVIRPGATRTGMHVKSGLAADSFDPNQFMPAKDAARMIDKSIRKGPSWSSVGTGNALLWRTGRTFPGFVDWIQARRAR